MPSSTREGPYYQADEQPEDALDTLKLQNGLIETLLSQWSEGTEHLRQGDDINTRWERGSVVKLLLQHLAVREEAKARVGEALHREGRTDLAEQLEADGPGRREDISALEELVRGHQAMTLNTPDVDHTVMRVEARLRRELEDEGPLLEAAGEALGPAGERGLPSDRNVRRHAVTHPNPEPKWYDRVGALRAARAFYDHLRGSPHEGMSPKVDESREYVPGVEKDRWKKGGYSKEARSDQQND